MPRATRAQPFALALALAAGPIGFAAPQDGPSPPITVAWELGGEPAAERPYVGQTFELRLVLDLDDAWSRSALAQLFPKPLDLPVQVDTFEEPPRGLELLGTEEGLGPTVVVDGEVLRAFADRAVRGRRRVEIVRTARLTAPGPVELPAPLARYVAASSFREDLVQGLVPVDPESGAISGAPLALVARALPEEGRPVEFTGAIGTFRMGGVANPRAITLGETFTFIVTIQGGFLPTGAEPRLVDPSGDFEVVGSLVESEGHYREIELRPRRAGIERGPALALTAFNPETESYEVVHAEGPPIAVRAQGAAPPPNTPAEPDQNERPSVLFTVLTLGAVATLAVVSAVRRIRYRSEMRAAAEEAR